MGSIVVKEDRQTVNKFQSWYQEKMIASGNAARFEKVISKVYDFNRSYTDVKGKVLPVIITFIPEASFLKPVIPVITKVEHKMYDLGENVLLGGKRFIEANFIGVDGSSKEVVLPDIDVFHSRPHFLHIHHTFSLEPGWILHGGKPFLS